MTLFVVILFGLGSVLIISGIENVSLLETTADIWNNSLPAGGGSSGGGGGKPIRAHQRGGAPLPDVPTYADVRASYVQTWLSSQGR